MDSETQAGRSSLFEYDLMGRVTETQPPGGTNPAITEYDLVNGTWIRVTRGTTPETKLVITTTLDGFGRPIATANAVGVKTRTEYDAEGRKRYEGYPFTDGVGAGDIGVSITYDALDRIRRRTNPDSTFNERTYGPGTVTIRDEKNRNTVQIYSAFGNPDDARLVAVTDADQKLRTYSAAGQALQSHASRAGSWLAGLADAGNAANNTAAARKELVAILESGQVTTGVHKAWGSVVYVRLPDGRGAVWTAGGEFITFLERYSKGK